MCKCSQENCDLEVFESRDKCILHCEKDDWYLDTTGKKWNGKYLEDFWRNLTEHIEKEISIAKAKNPKLIKYNFEEVNLIEMIFPYINYEDFSFFNEFNVKKINFIKCKFKEAITYRYFENVEKLTFKETHFYENVIFSNENILKEVEFINCKFHKNFNISNTIFNESANFTQSEFKEVEFNSTIFKKGVFFNQTIFYNEIDLQMTFFYEKVNFHNIKCENIANRETARIIKDSFEQQNNIIEANNFYVLEMEKMEKELDPKKDFFEWIVFKTHGLVSNHSQDWLLSLFWIISLTFITSFIKVIDCNISQITEKIVLSSIVTAIILFININISNTKRIYYIICSLIYYILYSVLTKDLVLNIFSNTINPFFNNDWKRRINIWNIALQNHNCIFNLPTNHLNKTKYKKKINSCFCL